ncbi:leucine--tRNA ligase [bacterium]|nr:leucine--tRNA ligase [bacterium]
MKYNPQEIEKKWQDFWERNNFWRAQDFSDKPKQYILVEFPYPSGEGLHVGHVRGYTAMDIIARKRRMEGYNVLFPIGWDAFGLPAENYAIKKGIHPSKTVEKNIENYRRQIKSLGLSFDWSREINTTNPKYYKWTQWIFVQLFKKGLAYQAEIPINWCPSCKIGLAHEEVVGGKCERCGTPVVQKKKKQWMLRITKYADRLIDDLKSLDFLDEIKTQQIEWIGRSYGTEIDFRVKDSDKIIKVFTTRPDTLFGVTAVVIAPEHPLVDELIKPPYLKEAKDYIERSKHKTEFERTKLEKEKTGVFTGSYCINPVNNEEVAVWIGDYVIATYGGGAVMVVPAHDKRDYQFAKKYGLEIKEVIKGGDISREAFVEYGRLINSGEFSGMTSQEAIEKITQWLEKKGLGKKTVHYKLRDWIFSRQHYWGEPIPIVHCSKCGPVPVPEEELPVQLPYVEKYQPTTTGESPLATIEEWVNVRCPKCGGPARRETDTMPNWAGSNWYFMRYCDPQNDDRLADFDKLKYWLPVDWYDGGPEHITLHLLYSRFIYKFLYDIGVTPTSEPYHKRTLHGIVLAQDGRKMSKSLGNVVNPDDVIGKYGADTLRVYEMFMGPFDQAIAWNPESVNGVFKFLRKVWNLVIECKNNQENNLEVLKKVHQLNKKISEDIEQAKFNTAIAAFMEFVNFAQANKEKIGKKVLERMLLLLAPFAPHISEELWKVTGHQRSIFEEKWPEYNPELVKEETILLVIQVNGKVRDKIEVSADISQEEAKKLALKQEKVQNWIGNKEIKKVIFVPKKLINIVV